MIYKVFKENNSVNETNMDLYSDLCIIEMNSAILDLSNNINYMIESSNVLNESGGVIEKAKQIIAKILEAIKKFFSKVKEFFTKGKIKNSANKLKEAKRNSKSKKSSDMFSKTINIELSFYPVDPVEMKLNSQFTKDLENLNRTIDNSIDTIFHNGDGEMYDKKHYEDFKKICDVIIDNAREGSREIELSYSDLEKMSSDRLLAEVDKISDSIAKAGDGMVSKVSNLSKSFGEVNNVAKDMIHFDLKETETGKRLSEGALRVNLYSQDVLIYLQKVIAVVGGIGSNLLLDVASAYGKFAE